MSNKALDYVFTHSKTKGSARVLMLAIADMSNDDGECWPGKSHLEKKVNVIPRNIIKLVQECERLGELAVIERPDTTNTYLIIGMAKQARLKVARQARAKWVSPKKADSDTSVTDDTSVTGDTPPGVTDDTPLVSPVTPKPLSNPLVETSLEEQIDAKASIDATANAVVVINEPAISQPDLSQHSDSALMMNGEASSDAEQSQSDITTPAVALEPTTPAAPAEEKKSKGKKAKKEKAADPDAAEIAALINAWKVESKVIDPAAFSKKPYRDCAREMIALGITPDHVKGCTADLKAEDYWSGRALPFTTVAQNVVVWAEENTLSEHPDSLPIYEIKPNDEYPAGLPYGIKPDDPRAAIYRFDPTAADDPTVLEMTSSLWSDERDFYAKHDIPSPDTTGQHPTVKSQP